jgi:hypothetical protein
MCEKNSLATAPFAAAMKAQEPMSEQRRRLVGERLLALAGATRHETVDFWRGDMQILWCPAGTCDEDPDEWLALGYDVGGELSVTLLDPYGEPFAEWEGEDARPLLQLGRLGGCPRHEVNVELAQRDASPRRSRAA